MIAVIPSATLVGAVGHPVSVEVHVSPGLPGFTVVGLPDAAVRESRDRVRAALLSSGLSWPLRRVTVNLAPSGVRKGGAGLDLPIAVGLLIAAGELDGALSGLVPTLGDTALVGELGLDGSIRHVSGVIALADAITASRLVVPEADAVEAAAVQRGSVFGVSSLRQLVDLVAGRVPWPSPTSADLVGPEASVIAGHGPDLADVRGQQLGRRALEVSAAGGHHLLMIGPPGSGKTMLAERLPGLLPPLEAEQALEVSRVHSAAGFAMAGGGLLRRPPFRAPHHGASAVSLVGGGSWSMRPGEISLADHGVLFLDEMGEFSSVVLDALREPIEEGVVRVSRARSTVTFPARFLLVGAMNPCPCGEGGPPGACRCSEPTRARYARRLSAPLLDRFDLVVLLQRPDTDELLSRQPGESSAAVAGRVAMARQRAVLRDGRVNAQLSGAGLDRSALLSRSASALLERHLRSGALSARGYDRIRRVARTIADLAEIDRRGDADVDRSLDVTTPPLPPSRSRSPFLSPSSSSSPSPSPVDISLVEESHVAEALALRAARSVILTEAR